MSDSLTQTQAQEPWWAQDYPAQYYACPASQTVDGNHVVHWLNVATYDEKPSDLPAASDMIALTTDEWAARALVNQVVAGGAVSTYTPSLTLAEQATAALFAARTTVYNNYGILNEPTPDAWVTYLKALMAIANGTDTTSTALPGAPNASAAVAA